MGKKNNRELLKLTAWTEKERDKFCVWVCVCVCVRVRITWDNEGGSKRMQERVKKKNQAGWQIERERKKQKGISARGGRRRDEGDGGDGRDK